MDRRKRYPTEEVQKIMNWSENILESEIPSVENSEKLLRLGNVQARCTDILLTDERIEELEKKIVSLKLQRALYKNDLTELLNSICPVKEGGKHDDYWPDC